MRQKPLIGVNMDYRSTKKDSPALSFVTAGYFDSIAKAGGIPLVVPPMEEKDLATQEPRRVRKLTQQLDRWWPGK